MEPRGVLGAAAYLPHRRLDRTTIASVAGGGGGKGTRTVASYDEDTTTMGVEAARLALAGLGPGAADRIDALWFSTVAPAYADKTNATAIHAALRLDRASPAFDVNGAVRSAVGALRATLSGTGTSLVVAADLRSGLAGGPDEAAFGDGAAALVVGPAAEGAPLLAEVIGKGGATEEMLDRWRTPGEARSRVWEERFGETRYVPLGADAWEAALKHAGLVADQVDRVIVTGTHGRANQALAKKLGLGDRLVDDLASTVGNTGAAHPALLLTSALEAAEPGQVLALVTLADGADAVIFRVTDAIDGWRPARPLADQAAAGEGDIARLPRVAAERLQHQAKTGIRGAEGLFPECCRFGQSGASGLVAIETNENDSEIERAGSLAGGDPADIPGAQMRLEAVPVPHLEAMMKERAARDSLDGHLRRPVPGSLPGIDRGVEPGVGTVE